MPNYKVKEIYFTIQGEGFHTGRPAVFCRFTGCNLWNGKEEDRASAICDFCDTDFVDMNGIHGGKYLSGSLANKVKSLWPNATSGAPYVVCTGGEPLLQLDAQLVEAFHQVGFEVGIETNGTREAPEGIDWICVSPKPNTDIRLKQGDELKLIYPQPLVSPRDVEHWDFKYFYLQPMENATWEANTQATIDFCLKNPHWRLSLQTHKYVGLK